MNVQHTGGLCYHAMNFGNGAAIDLCRPLGKATMDQNPNRRGAIWARARVASTAKEMGEDQMPLAMWEKLGGTKTLSL